ncbi:MAG: 50S ribosomal protein L19 [Flavobacteriaceae bacterium]|jgi:large subunit ribosomal protein L19
MESLVTFVQNEFVPKKEFPSFQAGDTITVYYEIREGEKVRTQFFKGVVIQIKGTGATKTFTIRKMSGTVGVERIFPMNLPGIQKIEVNSRGKVRRSRIYYFRDLTGKKARIKERQKG